MTRHVATVLITAFLSPIVAAASLRREVPPIEQPIEIIKQQEQTPRQPEPLPRLRKPREEPAPQRQLLEEMSHERQLQKQQQPIHFGK